MKVVVCLGSNTSNAGDNVRQAIERMNELLIDMHTSGCYTTRPLSGIGNDYVNAVIAGYTDYTLEDFEKICKGIEHDFGRDDMARAKKRVPIDVDVVMADERVLRPTDFEYDYFRTGYLNLTR